MALSDYSGQPLSRANPLVKRMLAATFPTYKGRKIKARLWTGPRVLENYWDGGTRSFYVAIRVSDGAVSDFGTDNPFIRSTHDPVDLPEGVILAEHSIFCGADTGITFWMRQPSASLLDGPAGLLTA